MGISVISTNFYMSGSYINNLDTQQTLRDEGFDPTYYYTEREGPLKFWKMLLMTKRRYTLGNMKNLKNHDFIGDDIVITDFRGLVVMNHEDKEIYCSKLIVMDTVELTYHLLQINDAHDWFWWNFYYEDSIYKYLGNVIAKEIIFLIPPSGNKIFKEKYPNLESRDFFKKINTNVLKTIKVSNNGKLFHRWDEPNIIYLALQKIPSIYSLERDREHKIFEYKGFVYSRRKRLQYYEQFGRLIFEFIILGKEVHFVKEPFSQEDGLSDYLRHYDIKFNEHNQIITEPSELIGKMNAPYGESLWT